MAEVQNFDPNQAVGTSQSAMTPAQVNEICTEFAKRYDIDPAVLAKEVMPDLTDADRLKDIQKKSDANLGLSGIQLLLYATAKDIAVTQENREALDMVGGKPENFNNPEFVIHTRPNLTQPSPSRPSVPGGGIYSACAQYVGLPYNWGGKNLDNPKGVDCSGYVRGVFQKFGVDLPFSSQDQARFIGNKTGLGTTNTSCKNVSANDIPDNAVMTMGPKNGIGHVVIVTHNAKGERVVMQSMGHVGVCEMPLDKFVAYLHRQPDSRTLTVANSGPLLDNKLASVPVANQHENLHAKHTEFKTETDPQNTQPARVAAQHYAAIAPVQTVASPIPAPLVKPQAPVAAPTLVPGQHA